MVHKNKPFIQDHEDIEHPWYTVHSYRLGIFIFQIKANEDSKLREKFTSFFEIHNYKTRNQGDYVLPLVKKENTKNMISFKGTSFWNSLPTSLKECTALSRFKQELKLHLEAQA